MTERSRRETLFGICDAVARVGICFLFFALLLERDARIVYYIAQVIPITAWFTKIFFQSSRRQWVRTLLQYLMMVGIAALATLLFGRRPFGEVFRLFSWEMGIFAFFILFIINREYPFRPTISRLKTKRAFDFTLGVYGFIVLLSAFLSYFPDDSFAQLRKGLAAYLLIYLCLSDNFRSFESFKKLVMTAYLAVLTVALVVVVQGVVYPLGSYAVQNWLVRKEAVRLFAPGTLNLLHHVQFPFDHYHNTAFFLVVGLQIVMLQYFVTVRRISRRWVAATGIITFGALLFTLSRSGFITAFLTTLALIILTKRKYFKTLLVILVLLVLFMPGVVKDYYLELVRPVTYTDPASKVSLQLERWGVVGELIRRNPLIGTGYGWKQFKDVYRFIRPGAVLESKSHPYSWYFQVAHESGLPGFLAFLSYSAFLLVLLYQGWRQQPPVSYYHGINAALIALFLAPYIFGLFGFIPIGAPGLLTWLIYGMCASYMKLTVKPKDMDELRRELEIPNRELEEVG